MLSWIGWVATAVFAGSYFCRRPETLRRVQAAAAVLWVVYGALIHAAPVIVANLIVMAVALGSSFGRAAPGDPVAGEAGAVPAG
jgi:hypothetical protein